MCVLNTHVLRETILERVKTHGQLQTVEERVGVYNMVNSMMPS